MRDERRDASSAEVGRETLDPRPAVDKHEAFLAAVKPRDHRGGVLEVTDIIEADVRCYGWFGWRPDDAPGAVARAGKPAEQILWVSDRGRKPDPLKLLSRDALDALENGQQVPAAVVASES